MIIYYYHTNDGKRWCKKVPDKGAKRPRQILRHNSHMPGFIICPGKWYEYFERNPRGMKMKIIITKRECNGDIGFATFKGKTLGQVLNEIREFTKNKQAHYLGYGFGNKKSNYCDNWHIVLIDETQNLEHWLLGDYGVFTNEYNSYIVDKISISDGFYSFYTFCIHIHKQEDNICIKC